MLEIRGIKKKFKNKLILDDVNFNIRENQIVTLLGANGAGKTTLINCILKLYKVDEGNIIFNNKNIYELKNKYYYSNISVVLESSDNIYDYISGLDNIKYFLGLSNYKYKDYEEDMNYLLKLFGLLDHINKNAGLYSRGMKQKLAIVIALLSKPKLLILDEPTIGLDIKTKYQVLDILSNIVKERNVSILLTTHQVEILKVLDSRLLFLIDGKIKEYNNINELALEDSLIYEVKYIVNNTVLNKEEIGLTFKEIYEKYSNYEILSVSKKEYDIENLIMEKLYE